MSNKIDNQIVKVENTNNGGLRAIFNLDGVTLDTPIMEHGTNLYSLEKK